MENHPIPQDVTGFKFKLIGDMTVKQFAFLAVGCVLAFIFFKAPIYWFVKFPLSLFFATLGVSLAFLPIEGRPLDVMLVNFLRALFTPNQYIYQKLGGQLFVPIVVQKNQLQQRQTQPQSKEKLRLYLANLPDKHKTKHDEKEMMFLRSLTQMTSSPSIQQVAGKTRPSAPPRILSIIEEEKNKKLKEEPKPVLPQKQQEIKEELKKEEQLITQELEEVKKQETTQQEPVILEKIHEKVLELESQLSEVMAQRNQFERQLLNLRKTMEVQQQKVFTPTVATQKTETTNVRKIPKMMGNIVGAPITPDAPNYITGIVKDPRGNVLPNILIEVKDKDGNPVRAFKTNGLGQFASATPLLNGVYTVTFEDPKGKNKFDVIEISASGEIIPPIEVISTDEREELRKALFSENAPISAGN